jgi:hypothetical protein
VRRRDDFLDDFIELKSEKVEIGADTVALRREMTESG